MNKRSYKFSYNKMSSFKIQIVAPTSLFTQKPKKLMTFNVAFILLYKISNELHDNLDQTMTLRRDNCRKKYLTS